MSTEAEKQARSGGTVWDRPEHSPRERTPPRSRKELARAAIALADREGPDALTMRRLAQETGIATMSLYSYVRNKQELIDLVADEMCGEIVIEGELPREWREAVTLIARTSYRWFLSHPWIVDYMDHPDPLAGPNIIKHMEQSLEAVANLPLDPEIRRGVPRVVDEYVFGAALNRLDDQRQSGYRQSPAERERVEQGRAFFAEMLASGEYPYLAEETAATGRSAHLDGDPDDRDERFERGLRWLLDGIEAEAGRPAS